jgi:FAD/FMN-containing dehydrogenase
LKLITTFEAKFAVRSGGHNANPGYGSVGAGGVLFDLRGLDQITLSGDKSFVSVGPGATWGAVYRELEREGLTVAGGRVSDVGVGGLVLGGEFPRSKVRVDGWEGSKDELIGSSC